MDYIKKRKICSLCNKKERKCFKKFVLKKSKCYKEENYFYYKFPFCSNVFFTINSDNYYLGLNKISQLVWANTVNIEEIKMKCIVLIKNEKKEFEKKCLLYETSNEFYLRYQLHECIEYVLFQIEEKCVYLLEIECLILK